MPPPSYSIPHRKLRLTVVLLSFSFVASSLQKADDLFGWIMFFIGVPLGIWISHFGVYRASLLHWLWGWACLIVSLIAFCVIPIILWGGFDGFRIPPSSLSLFLITLSLLPMPVIAYLLLFDREVAQYRRRLPGVADN